MRSDYFRFAKLHCVCVFEKIVLYIHNYNSMKVLANVQLDYGSIIVYYFLLDLGEQCND